MRTRVLYIPNATNCTTSSCARVLVWRLCIGRFVSTDHDHDEFYEEVDTPIAEAVTSGSTPSRARNAVAAAAAASALQFQPEAEPSSVLLDPWEWQHFRMLQAQLLAPRR
jgi:hypothetical protein